MDRIQATPRTDVSVAIRPILRERAPKLTELVRADAAIHDGLVRDAHAALGSPGARPVAPWRGVAHRNAVEAAMQLAPPHGGDLVSNDLLSRNRAVIHVPLGTQVDLPGATPYEPSWTVVGAGNSDRLELARMRADGTGIQRTTRRWAQLVVANPVLAEQHVLPTNARSYPVGFRPAADAALGARLGQVPYELVSMQPIPEGAPTPILDSGTWEQLARRSGLTRLRPIPAYPETAMRAANLVSLTRPDAHRVVIGMESSPLIRDVDLLIGVGALPPGHRAERDLRRVEAIAGWFAERGLDTWRGPTGQLFLRTGDRHMIGNAAAVGYEDIATVILGPRDFAHVTELTRRGPRDWRQGQITAEHVIRENWDAVLAHEVGHVSTGRLWGTEHHAWREAAMIAGRTDEAARLLEFDIAHEAMSDLYGAAFSRSRDLGVRDIGRLRHDFGTLDRLRASVLRAGVRADPHLGTQLITKPMLEVQRVHGWDAMGDVAAAAARRIGTRIKQPLDAGGIARIDLPAVALALQEAAATRFGEADSAVVALSRAFRQLRML